MHKLLTKNPKNIIISIYACTKAPTSPSGLKRPSKTKTSTCTTVLLQRRRLVRPASISYSQIKHLSHISSRRREGTEYLGLGRGGTGGWIFPLLYVITRCIHNAFLQQSPWHILGITKVFRPTIEKNNKLEYHPYQHEKFGRNLALITLFTTSFTTLQYTTPNVPRLTAPSDWRLISIENPERALHATQTNKKHAPHSPPCPQPSRVVTPPI